MKNRRIIATFLSLALLFGSFAVLMPTAMAAEVNDTEADNNPFVDYETTTELAMDRSYDSLEEYVESFMELRVTSGAYQLWANPYTGEVALKNRVTGQIITTNPADFGETDTTSLPDATKEQLLSQVIISYKDETGINATMTSFKEAASRGQIVIRDIKKGIRVEYTIGRLATTYLLPGYIMKDRFESEILAPFEAVMNEQLKEAGQAPYDEQSGQTYEEYLQEMFENEPSAAFESTYFAYKALLESYSLNDPNANLSTSAIKSMQEVFPITAETDENGKFYAIYALDNKLVDRRKSTLEGYVKQYCPEYGYDDLEADHTATYYEAEDTKHPLFRLALEYVIQDDGMTVRLPAGAIRYDETLLTLNNIMITPYLGAGCLDTADNNGYVFFPDGSGSIMEFSDLYNEHVKVSVSRSNRVYGTDYAYYSVEGSQHQESVRMPVYGVVDTQNVKTYSVGADGKAETLTTQESRGFLAIVTEGDALTDITVEFGATMHPFASVFSRVTPRPSDEYSLENAISASGAQNQKWTVVSDRKYTGNYTTKIIMLTDKQIGDSLIADPKSGVDSYYRADWIGMAHAYRDYLESNGVIDRLKAEDVKDQLPLYLEAFGSFETTERILSMPVTVDKALTTFEDVQKMYSDLSTIGIKNVNFRLVGFANGGMESRYPAKLKWEKAVGGSDGFESLLADARAKGYGIYPDFDFLYIRETGWNDGISEKESSVRTVDDRYASKQVYDAVYQDFRSYFEICVASSQLNDFFASFSENYAEYDSKGISLALLATDLNSNFDKDDPTNREDAKAHYVELLQAAAKKYSVMTEGGNMYAVSYTDHMLDMPIESSNYSNSSHTVPFIGMVLHGYLNMTGTALNEAGDVNYNIMRSIENGYAPYYILSYNSDATALMKQNKDFSKYYSIRYDIWFGSGTVGTNSFKPGALPNQYKLLNSAIGDLQTALIEDYDFLVCERVQKPSEVIADAQKLLAKIDEAIYRSAYDMEAKQIRFFRRDLDIYNTLAAANLDVEENVTDAERIAIIGEKLGAYLFDVEYKRPSLYSKEEMKAAIDLFVAAGKANPETFDATLALDPKVASVVANFEEAYGEFYGSMLDSDKPIFLPAAERYVKRLAEDYAARYLAGAFTASVGQTVAIKFDKAAIVASLEEVIGVSLNDEQLAVVDASIKKYTRTTGDTEILVDEITVTKSDFEFADYTLDDGRCTMVTYRRDNGEEVRFALNYNMFTVTVEYTDDSAFSVTTFAADGTKTTVSYNAGEAVTITIPSYAFVRID